MGKMRLFCLLLAGLCASASGLAEDLPPRLQAHILSDEEIALRCQASLRGNFELLETEDGQRLTRCELTYRRLRDAALAYGAEVKNFVGKIRSAAVRCESDNTQANCLKNGKELAALHSEGYTGLADTAEALGNSLAEGAKAGRTGSQR